ncbi:MULTISPECIES: DUF4238 domain-containing protein [Acinetobacter]|uniref:DUF4238 domain-containing protein n=1 Tax=Acinetobacter TaxID=469 RepID=UPI00148B7BCE|nr:DUF4238 domain-containing protein [Acinetobacter sp. MYb10]QLD60627.1 DUF4238 domain-containing protein [Acinetobacter sp. MYb10]
MNIEKINIKKNHHFVSQFYLERWANGSLLRISDGRGSVFHSDVKNIAFKKNFYKIVMFNEVQIDLFKKLCISSGFGDFDIYRLTIEPILDFQFSIRNLEKRILKLKNLNINVDEEYKKLNKLKEIYKHNTIEDKFSDEEAQYSSVLKKVVNSSDKTNFTFKEYCTLIFFIIFQLYKTPKKIINIGLGNDDCSIKKIFEDFKFDKDEFHTFKIYFLFCIAELINQTRIKRVDKINIIYNKSVIDFITSDDPCFNQKFENGGFFIKLPVSPRVAIEICENNDENTSELFNFYNTEHNFDSVSVSYSLINFFEVDIKYVSDLNKEILARKDKHIYCRKKV